MSQTARVELRSDNAAGVAPAIMDAVVAANTGSALAYGGDPDTARLDELVKEVFEHDRARAFPVTSGTAANALGLSTMTPPWGAVWCHETAHIITNEGGATSALGGGVVMHGVGGAAGLIDPERLDADLKSVRWGDNHQSQPKVLSLTQPNDLGNIYSIEQLVRLGEVAADYAMTVHLDGARLANAIARLDCRPADLTWRAGITTLSLGATKNGALSAEAIVTFDDAVAAELIFRTKRVGHVTSKMRYQSAQLVAYLTDDYWLDLAAHANDKMQRLLTGIDALQLGDRFCRASPATIEGAINMAFFDLNTGVTETGITETGITETGVTETGAVDGLRSAGLDFYQMGSQLRFVTSWATSDAEIDTALGVIATVLGAGPANTDR